MVGVIYLISCAVSCILFILLSFSKDKDYTLQDLLQSIFCAFLGPLGVLIFTILGILVLVDKAEKIVLWRKK